MKHAKKLLINVFALVLVSAHSAAAAECEHHKDKHEMPAGEALKDNSVYNATGKWADSTGKSVSFSDLKGKPVVVAMAYTRCQYVCPRIVSDMKRVRSELPKSKRNEVRFVLLSLDSDYDRPEKLREYAKKHGLDSQWTLLHGEEDSVQEVSALLGVKYRKESNGVDFSHSYMITLLDEGGVIRKQRIGTSEPTSVLVEALSAD